MEKTVIKKVHELNQGDRIDIEPLILSGDALAYDTDEQDVVERTAECEYFEVDDIDSNCWPAIDMTIIFAYPFNVMAYPSAEIKCIEEE